MEKGFNLRIVEFKQDLVKVVNESGLPISVVAMAMESIMNDVRTTERNVIDKEYADFQQKVEEGGLSES